MASAGVKDLSWEEIRGRVVFPPRESILRLAVELSKSVPGDIVEFGVADGGSTRVLRGAVAVEEKRIFACDSFKGLPEKYENAEVGTFACTPPVIRGVEIVQGYFDDSLTAELAGRVGRVALASLDADLYSSTICALRWLTPLLGSGSILLFDEFIGEKESEKRAFEDWSKESGVRTVLIGEFLREPSGWGTTLDKRTLYQVVGKELLPERRATISLRDRLLTSGPANVARKIRNSIRRKLAETAQ